MKYDVVHNVLIAKSCTSEHFKDELLATCNKLLCEALIDEFWGSGLSYNLTIRTKPEHWPAANNLGKILMNARADLRKEDLKENQSPTQLSATDMLSPTVALPSTTGTEERVSRAPKRIQMSNSKLRSSSASASMFRDFISKNHNFKHLNVSLHKSPKGSGDHLDGDDNYTSQSSFTSFVQNSESLMDSSSGEYEDGVR